MRNRISRGRMLWAGMLLAVWLLSWATVQAVRGQEEPELPAQVVAAWQEAEAQVGWMGKDRFGSLVFQQSKEGLTGAIAAFEFWSWEEGRVSKLPDPGKAFGLHLIGTEVTDARLKELAGLKSLQELHLGSTQVTDVGLKELAGLKSLQWLHLSGTPVSDAGVKQLRQALPECQIVK